MTPVLQRPLEIKLYIPGFSAGDLLYTIFLFAEVCHPIAVVVLENKCSPKGSLPCVAANCTLDLRSVGQNGSMLQNRPHTLSFRMVVAHGAF